MPEAERPSSNSKHAVIIGAGPAGLTAASELLKHTKIVPIILEKSEYMGGLSRTVNYKGNRIDIGGHRFFSKSDRVMQWWLDHLPMQALDESSPTIHYQGRSARIEEPPQGPDPDQTDQVMLLRRRRSRIYYLRRFFNYPVTLSVGTVVNLGLFRTIRVGLSYLKSVWFPIRPEKNLEQFFINRFGRKLYLTFFRSYTEKVWGVPCHKISAQWGAQRIKGLSIMRAIRHAILKPFRTKDVGQKTTETSLIEQFLYPKFGPGQMWELVSGEIERDGGQIIKNQEVQCVHVDGNRITSVEAINNDTGQLEIYEGDYFFSTMPIRELVAAMDIEVPPTIKEISDGLVYRDFITVGLLLDELKIRENNDHGDKLIRDNWIYIHEPEVTLGRLQIFNNWSPYMVADTSKVWLGLEYFCNSTDDIWKMNDDKMIKFATEELAKIGFIETSKVLDGTVIRTLKTYPAYFGTYDRFDELRAWLDEFENLFLLGRNGMHRYNNQDHAMLTAMTAVENIQQGRTDKSNIWAVNTELKRHEERDNTNRKS